VSDVTGRRRDPRIDDTELGRADVERVEEYAARNEVTSSEALRRLLREGDDSWQGEPPDASDRGATPAGGRTPAWVSPALPAILASAVGVAVVSLYTTVGLALVGGVLLGVVTATGVSVLVG